MTCARGPLESREGERVTASGAVASGIRDVEHCTHARSRAALRHSSTLSSFEYREQLRSLLFLDSIDKFRALPDSTLVLPSHGRPFTGDGAVDTPAMAATCLMEIIGFLEFFSAFAVLP